MSKFIARQLADLPELPLIEPDFEAILAARMETYVREAAKQGINYDVNRLIADPIKIDQILGADREVNIKAEINDGIRAVMLSTSWGAYLDGIAKTYYGISRLETGEDENSNIIYESDDDFKPRIELAPEAVSTAGPEGGYVFHLLELDGYRDIADAASYGEEDGAFYNDGTAVLAPEVLNIILPTLEYNGTGATLGARAYDACSAKKVRPLGDKVTIEMAHIHTYQIEAVLKFQAGIDKDALKAQANAAVEVYILERRRIGYLVQRLGIGAALKVPGVSEVELISPPSDIDPGSKGACECTDIIIRAERETSSWRA